jgi:hypothetical protein
MAFLEKKMSRRRGFPVMRLATGFACAVLLFFGGLFSYQSYFTASAYVDIDVNPSIELALNRYGRVIGANAYNDDGTNLLAKVPVKNRTYTEALRLLVDEMYAQGSIQEAGLFSLTLQTDNDEQKGLIEELNTVLSSLLAEKSPRLERDLFVVDSITKSESHDLHLSPAKYLAIQELRAVDPTATFESCRDHSISELRQQTHAHQNGGHGAATPNGHESKNGHHGGDSSGGGDNSDSSGGGRESDDGNNGANTGGSNGGAGSHGHSGS